MSNRVGLLLLLLIPDGNKPFDRFNHNLVSCIEKNYQHNVKSFSHEQDIYSFYLATFMPFSHILSFG